MTKKKLLTKAIAFQTCIEHLNQHNEEIKASDVILAIEVSEKDLHLYYETASFFDILRLCKNNLMAKTRNFEELDENLLDKYHQIVMDIFKVRDAHTDERGNI